MGYSLNEEIEDYLNKNDVRLPLLEELYEKVSMPMSSHCTTCVIIPAHNEEKNIPKLIDDINSQVFTSKDIIPDNFEVIIVDNNSHDNTGSVALEYIRNNRCNIKIIVISVDFEGDERVVGSARRVGADFALYRASMRENSVFDELFIVSMDADNPIPYEHFEKVAITFRDTKADTICGHSIFDPTVFPNESKFRKLSEAVFDYYLGILDRKPLPSKLSGQNHAFNARMYMKIGGYPRWQTVHDTYMGIESERLNGKIESINSYIVQNPRRMLYNPIEFLTGDAWEKKKMDSPVVNEHIRCNLTCIEDYPDDLVKLGVTSFVDDRALELALSEKLILENSILDERKRFVKCALKHEINKTFIPDNDLFCVAWASTLELRRQSGRKVKSDLFKKDISVLEHIISKDIDCFITENSALWLLEEEGEVPDIVTIALNSKYSSILKSNLLDKGYNLFKEIYFNKKRFVQKVSHEDASYNYEDRYLILKINENGIPNYDESYFAVRFFNTGEAGLEICKKSMLYVSDKLTEYNIKDSLKIANKVFLMITRGDIKENGLKILYKSLSESERIQYHNLINKKVDNLYNMLLARFKEQSLKSDFKPEFWNDIITCTMGKAKTIKQNQRSMEFKNEINNLLESQDIYEDKELKKIIFKYLVGNIVEI